MLLLPSSGGGGRVKGKVQKIWVCMYSRFSVGGLNGNVELFTLCTSISALDLHPNLNFGMFYYGKGFRGTGVLKVREGLK